MAAATIHVVTSPANVQNIYINASLMNPSLLHSSSMAPALLFLLALLAFTTTSCALDMAALRAGLLRASRSVNVSLSTAQQLDSSYGYPTVALTDCALLYQASEARLVRMLSGGGGAHTRDDGVTWLSGVLANHRTCLEGLGHHNEGLVSGARNLTVLIGEALALYARSATGRARVVKGGSQKPIPRHNEASLATWSAGTGRADMVVARDGSGSHKTINAALEALTKMGRNRPERIIIYVKAGVYNERVLIDRKMNNVMLVGDGIDKTIVTGDQNVPAGSSTYSSATFGVSGDGFWARDMTFENTAGPEKHQAVAARVSSDLSIFYRCSFRGYQDTLFVHSLRQFYRDCHVLGTIDFIFGDASAVFQNCDILVRRPMAHQANVITAQGREHPDENTGISIQGSRVGPAPDFAAVKGEFRSFLGRPWRKYSRTVFMKTELDGLVDPRGWAPWSGEFALSTLYYAEYMNSGRGASTGMRVRWPGFHVMSSQQQAFAFCVSRFIQGDSWIPQTQVPFSLQV